MKYATSTLVVRWSGGTATLTEGMSVDDDHPLAIERPDLFHDGNAPAQLAAPPVIERATRAPGERRAVRAPRASSKKAVKESEESGADD